MSDKIQVSVPPEQKRSCGTCKFSNKIAAQGPEGKMIIGQETLLCMRRPPLITSVTQGGQSAVMTQFPPVTPDMFCYDYWPEGEPLIDPELFDMLTGDKMTEN